MISTLLQVITQYVAPRVGAWIEIEVNQNLHSLSVSLPVWERGLKYTYQISMFATEPSLPVWERGLKYMPVRQTALRPVSLPVWERGLKSS